MKHWMIIVLMMVALTIVAWRFVGAPADTPEMKLLIQQENARIKLSQEHSVNLIGGPTGDDALKLANEKAETLNQSIVLILVSMLDIGSILTLVAALKAKRFATVILVAVIAALIEEMISALIKPAYPGLSFFPYRMTGQLLVALIGYIMRHSYERLKNAKTR